MMQNVVITAVILLIVWAMAAVGIRENLRQRGRSRHYRAKFIAAANDLVAKAEFPQEHAAQLVAMASIRGGWLTRLMVVSMMKRAMFGTKRTTSRLNFEDVPENLRPQYVTAILSFILADSYRSAFFGRALRSAHDWMSDAVRDVKPDVKAHATRRVIAEVNVLRQSRRYEHEALACA